MIPEWLKEALPTIIPIFTLMGFFWNALSKKFEKIDARFEKIDEQFEKVNEQFNEVRKDLSDIKERVTFLEAQTILFNAVPDVNIRSEAAKRTWQRRKAKQMESIKKNKKLE